MKITKIISIITMLLFSVFLGNIVSHAIVDANAYPLTSIVLPYSLSFIFFVMCFMNLTPVGSLAVYALINIRKTTASTMPGAGGGKKDLIIIFRWDDVETMPARDSKGVKISGSIVLKTGSYMAQIYATPSSIAVSQKSVGEEDAKGFEQEIKFNHPGSELEIQEFIQNNLNQNLGVIVRYCDNSVQKLLGEVCAPLQLENESIDDKDKNVSGITLKSSQKGKCIAKYTGSLTLAEDSWSGAA